MAPTKKYENLRKEAAEKRRNLVEEEKENLMGLRSVVAVKQATNQWTRQQNHEKHLRIIQWVNEVNSARKDIGNQWNKPSDWRMVTGQTVHK